MNTLQTIAWLSLFAPALVAGLPSGGGPTTSPSAQCVPFTTQFASTPIEPVSSQTSKRDTSDNSNKFVAISPSNTYKTTDNGLELYLNRPSGQVHTKNGVNDELGDGATVNSTSTLLYGKVTFEMRTPAVEGMITAAILIADQRDEIDIEILGSDPTHWQTNVYAPDPSDTKVLYGVLGEIDNVGSMSDITSFHNYTIDWNSERIQWSIDGQIVRTLVPSQTLKHGTLHYPSHPTRLQIGIWDASSPIGTSQWAGGPINWDSAPKPVIATFKSVVVECPYN